LATLNESKNLKKVSQELDKTGFKGRSKIGEFQLDVFIKTSQGRRENKRSIY
jgi:hypothetical protein